MRNLRKIFEHLGFYERAPALAIRDMGARVLADTNISPDDRILLSKILAAVILIAEGDDEKAAKKPTPATPKAV